MGAVVLGVPTTSQTPLSGQFSLVLAVVPTDAISLSPHVQFQRGVDYLLTAYITLHIFRIIQKL